MDAKKDPGKFTIRFCISDPRQMKAVDELNAQYEQQVAENERLQDVIDNSDKDSYIERVAREKLGYVKPGEKVYYNITPNN